MEHILVRQDEQRQFNQLPIIKERLESNNYISNAGRKAEQDFYNKVSAKLAVLEWADEHYEQAQEVEGTEGKKRIISVLLPFYDDKTKKVIPFKGVVTIWECKTNYVDRRNERYHWVYPSLDFRGRRLDWQEELFADILAHQDNFEEWCKSYTESLNGTEYPYFVK